MNRTREYPRNLRRNRFIGFTVHNFVNPDEPHIDHHHDEEALPDIVMEKCSILRFQVINPRHDVESHDIGAKDEWNPGQKCDAFLPLNDEG